MLDIRHEILQYLANNDSGTLIPLNKRLLELLEDKPVRIYKGLLRGMTQDLVAEISGNIGFLGATHGGIEQNLHNQQINARILPNGYKELNDTISEDRQTQLTEKQLSDFPKSISNRNKVLSWTIIGILLATIIGALAFFLKK